MSYYSEGRSIMLEVERDHLRRIQSHQDAWIDTTYCVEWGDRGYKRFSSFQEAISYQKTKPGAALTRVQLYKH